MHRVTQVLDVISNTVYARKVIKTNRRNARRTFNNEIGNLRRLGEERRHRHIVELVCFYTHKTELGLILLPVARCNLETFLDEFDASSDRDSTILHRCFGCLTSALAFIHDKEFRHKDIKPENILIHGDNVLFTDFGHSFDFQKVQVSGTGGIPDAFTAKYAAPEVLDRKRRGRKADVFSLGCVFLEIATVLARSNLDDLNNHLSPESHEYSEPYCTSLQRLRGWIQILKNDEINTLVPPLEWCLHMLEERVDLRPGSGELLASMLEGSENRQLEDEFFCLDCLDDHMPLGPELDPDSEPEREREPEPEPEPESEPESALPTPNQAPTPKPAPTPTPITKPTPIVPQSEPTPIPTVLKPEPAPTPIVLVLPQPTPESKQEPKQEPKPAAPPPPKPAPIIPAPAPEPAPAAPQLSLGTGYMTGEEGRISIRSWTGKLIGGRSGTESTERNEGADRRNTNNGDENRESSNSENSPPSETEDLYQRPDEMPPPTEEPPPFIENKIPPSKASGDPPPQTTRPPPPQADVDPAPVPSVQKPPPIEQKPPPIEQKPPLKEQKPTQIEQQPPPIEQKPTPREQKPPPREQKPPPREQKPTPIEQKRPPIEQKPPPREQKPKKQGPRKDCLIQ